MARWVMPKENVAGDRYCSNCKALVPYYQQGNYCMFCGEKITEIEYPDGVKPHHVRAMIVLGKVDLEEEE